MRITAFCGVAGLAMAMAAPSAWACSATGRGLTIIHYPIGSVATTARDQERLRRFADVARHREHVCVLGQADAQGEDDDNQHLARARAESVGGLLKMFGVPAEKIELRTQPRAITIWGALDDNQPNDRRVTVTYE